MSNNATRLLDYDYTDGEFIDPNDEKRQSIEMDALERWSNALQGESGVKFRVHGINETTGKEPHCFSFAPTDYDMDALYNRLRDDYPEYSAFRIKAYDGKGKIRINERVDVARAHNVRKPAGNNEDQANSQPQSVNDLAKLMLEMQQKTDDRFQLLLSHLSDQSRNNNQSMTPQSMVDMMIKMRDLDSNHAPRQDPAELFMKGIEFAKDLVGGSGETNESDVLLKAIESFSPVLQQLYQQSNPQQPKGDASAQTNLADQLKQMATSLVDAAARNSDPYLYAEWLLDVMPAGAIEGYRNHGLTVAAALRQMDSRVDNHPQWFGHFDNAVVELLDGDGTGPGSLNNALNDSEDNAKNDPENNPGNSPAPIGPESV